MAVRAQAPRGERVCGSWTDCKLVEWRLLIRWSGEFRARGMARGWECCGGVVVVCGVCLGCLAGSAGNERETRVKAREGGARVERMPSPKPRLKVQLHLDPARPAQNPPNPRIPNRQRSSPIFSLQVPLPSSPQAAKQRVLGSPNGFCRRGCEEPQLQSWQLAFDG